MPMKLIFLIVFSLASIALFAQKKVVWENTSDIGTKGSSVSTSIKEATVDIFFVLEDYKSLELSFLDPHAHSFSLSFHNSSANVKKNNMFLFDFPYHVGDKIGISQDDEQWDIRINDLLMFSIPRHDLLPEIMTLISFDKSTIPAIYHRDK